MKLIKVTEHVSYLHERVNIGLIKTEKGAVLIDSGLDESTARKILRILKKEDIKIKYLINTHGHADHFGGNKYLQEKLELETLAPAGEEFIIKYSGIESAIIYGGAYPIPELQNKFLNAEPANVDRVLASEGDQLNFQDFTIKVVPLPGHSLKQIGLSCEGVLFTADAYFTPDLIDKHGIPYYTDINSSLETFNFLLESNYDYYIPGHGKGVSDIKSLIQKNKAIFNEIESEILQILNNKLTDEQLYEKIVKQRDIEINSIHKYFILKTVINAFLSYLSHHDLVKCEIADSKLVWSKQ